ncbi:MAG TPA: hypothetical protein VGA20_04185 [Gemmatimonadales bacterium]
MIRGKAVGARRLVCTAALATAVAACGPGDPCETSFARRVRRTSLPYSGEWVVVRGDTLTLPDGMGDRFRLAAIRLDTTTVVVNRRACRFTGVLVFSVPRADTLSVTWVGYPEQLVIFGWPPELGPFAGIGAQWWTRDSLRGAILFDERMGVRMAPGVTAEFVAARR